MTPLEDAERIYEDALSRVELIRGQWEAEGEPVLLTGPRGGVQTHPLLRMLQSAEKHADKMREAVTRPRVGRPTEAVFDAIVAPSPAAQLRARERERA